MSDLREVVAEELRKLLRDSVTGWNAAHPLHPKDSEGKWADTPGAGGSGLASKLANALSGQDALDAAPAKLKRAPRGHAGHYEGAELTAPDGAGSALALAQYQGLEYQAVNTFLRGGYNTQSGPGDLGPEGDDFRKHLQESADIAAEIDKTMSVSPLASDVGVQRVIRHGAQVFGRDVWYGGIIDFNEKDFDVQDQQWERWDGGERPDLTGLQWVDHGFQSTSARLGAAQVFGRRWPELNNKSDGEPVVLNILVPKGTNGIQLSELEHEAEILLDRGLVMEVAADHGVGEDGFRRLDVRVVGRHGDH
ncbi:MAG TPA: ADP-ribosyltransferase [Micromonosporaceae bacterium]|nr:ADP-ribosyltransferase [Micromonosporaceae bacterium]